MHSKIIQMETRPIEEMGRMESGDFDDHWFTESIADYVDDDYDSDDTLKTFEELLGAYPQYVEFFEDNYGRGVIFREGFTKAFLAGKYEVFCDALNALQATATLEGFCNSDIVRAINTLNTAFDSQTGLYIKNDDLDLKTLDSFMRSMKTDTKYYFGGTVDYHF